MDGKTILIREFSSRTEAEKFRDEVGEGGIFPPPDKACGWLVVTSRIFDQFVPGGWLVAGIVFEDGDANYVSNMAIAGVQIDQIDRIPYKYL